MVKENLLTPYRKDVAAGKLESRDTATNALGTNVDGYVIPMFHSQIALAYMPDLVKSPPKTFTELEAWAKANPKQFGYNGVKGGMSGVGFVTGWVAAHGARCEQAREGPVRREPEGRDRQVARRAQGVQQERRADAGQRRHARHAESRRDRDGPGVGRHVLYVAGRRPAEPEGQARAAAAGTAGTADVLRGARRSAAHRGAREEVHRPRGERRKCRPRASSSSSTGIRASIRSTCRRSSTPAVWNKLFTDISPGDLSKYGRPFPLSEYFTDILEAYERVVLK